MHDKAEDATDFCYNGETLRNQHAKEHCNIEKLDLYTT
jgi:hypothetical protein